MAIIASYSNGHTIAHPQSQNPTSPKSPASTEQVGGDHYRKYAIQPIDFITANKLDFCEGNVVKYVTRWRDKGGVEDLRKARHYLNLLIERSGTD